MPPKKILILTFTAGGGHLQAAKAKYCEMHSAYPNAVILEQDLLFNWVGKWLGILVKHLWGRAQSRGNIFFITYLSRGMSTANYVFWLPVFLSTIRLCLKHNIDTIIDTQPVATPAIVKALRFLKWWKNKDIVYQKILTDLPTKDALHFFSGCKQLSKKDHPFIKILTAKPLLENGETEADFWKTYCNLPMETIVYSPPPLRPAFCSPQNITNSLDISFSSPGDLHITHKILSYGSIQTKRFKDHLSIPITPEDKVTVLMLGANPNPKAVLSYTNHFIQILKNSSPSPRKDLLFIFCNSQVSSLSNLRKELLNLIQTNKDYPQSLTIIPIPHQNDSIIAALFSRSNATITKSGGLTSMELLAVAHGQIWIHQEPPSSFHKGMPLWEHGNARYLEIYKGAKLISPSTFEELSKEYFSSTPELQMSYSSLQ